METHANVKEISVAEANSVRPKFIKPWLLEPQIESWTKDNSQKLPYQVHLILEVSPFEAKLLHRSGGIRMNQAVLRLRTQIAGFQLGTRLLRELLADCYGGKLFPNSCCKDFPWKLVEFLYLCESTGC